MPVVHVRLPGALVDVAARKRELARAVTLVVLPVPRVLGAALVTDLALAVPELAGDLQVGLVGGNLVSIVDEFVQPEGRHAVARLRRRDELEPLATLVSTARVVARVNLDLLHQLPHLVLSDKNGPIGARVLAGALAEAALPVALVHVAQLAVEELAVPTHPILRPLALVLVAVDAAVLAMPMVHAIEPLTLVDVATRKRVLALPRPLVVRPLSVELVANLVRHRALAVPCLPP
mmetsp:Transcript_51736/g.124402  ORF Transcript_51736/g.124402 Transcript_51736/m.124402 type:complete len:234 (-) Transcript_51736:310-1011(-)